MAARFHDIPELMRTAKSPDEVAVRFKVRYYIDIEGNHNKLV